MYVYCVLLSTYNGIEAKIHFVLLFMYYHCLVQPIPRGYVVKYIRCMLYGTHVLYTAMSPEGAKNKGKENLKIKTKY